MRFGDGGIAVDKRERGSGRRSRWGAWLLAAALMCALWSGAALAAPAEGASLIAESAAPKPQITIQGNVVVDKGKPTGFYELALCVRTARTVTEKGTDKVVDEEVYATELAAALASGKPEDRAALDEKYDVRNYPFQTASAAMTVNLDALTAVTWGAGTPVYEAWTATGTSTSGTYADHDDDYPRGINTKADGQPDIFTDLSPVENATGGQKVRVRLDTAKPDEVNNATAFIEEMEFDAADPTRRTGLLTLTANTTTTRKVVYEIPTPVVVIRFAYDKNRFKNLEVGNPDDLASEPNTSDFWLGLDRNHPLDGPNVSGKTPLTYLGAQATGGAHLYADSDAQVAGSSVFQSVLYTQNLSDDGVTQEPTRFYYYLGAETPSYEGTKREYLVHDEATDTDSEETLYVPTTLGTAILANRDDVDPTAGDPETGTYSFFQNLLTIKENTLRLILVNAETYRKPTGGVGGAQILFYDWNDDLIGALVVDPEGDARALVNEYVEKTFIHPELRASALAEGAKDLTELPTQPDYPKYQNLVSSLERDYTYRGDYAYTVGEDNDPSKIFGPDSDEPGEDYPLTDKLDYAFYRRVTTQVEKDVPDPKDPTKTVKTRYYATAPVEEGPDPAFLEEDEEYDGYLYPYVYGWAIVEDETQDLTQKNWILHKDSVKTEDVWTTFGVGELADLDPANAAAQTIPGTTTNYTYAVTEKDAAWYLRFADFSAMEKMLRPGQDVLIVKAVYEPGRSLLAREHYTVVEDSLKVQRYGYAASEEASVYSFQYQYRRATRSAGPWQGVRRIREPAIKTGYTYDINAFDSEDKNLNPSKDTKPFFLKSLSNNDDILNIDLTTGGSLWKIEYILVDAYKGNVASGAQRSAGGELDLKNNFDYEFGDGTEYPDRQGTDGFVLEATMNTLLDEATKTAKGEAGELSVHFSLGTVNDLNLRTNDNGDPFDWGNYDYCATYLQDLVNRLYASNDPQYRDPKTGNIVLGWHQIQRHILFCMKAGSAVPGIYDNGVLMSETACAGFPWCRLDSCAAEMTVDIYTIGDILAAIGQAEGETGDKKPATEALNKLLTDNPSLLDTFWLRKSEIGEKFPEGAGHRQAVLDALKKVYTVLKTAGSTNPGLLEPDALKALTQEQVQEMIVTGEVYSTPVQTYWWANGGKRPVTGWQDFIEGGMLVVSGKVPDALDAMTNGNPALANAVNDMISYAPPTGAPANVGWFRYKESQEEDNAFQSVEQFKDAWMKALRTLSAHYTLPDQWDSIPWEEIQYALIEPAGDYKTAEEILRAKKDYWWKNGGQPKLTYERLMEAASEWRANGFTDSAKLDKLLAKGAAPINNEVYIRRNAAGSGFTGVDQFKDTLKLALQVLGFVNNSGDFLYDSGGLRFSEDPVTHEKTYALSIYQFQYLLLNASRLVGQPIPNSDKIKDPNDPDVVCNYWWIPAPHTPTEAQRIGDIMDLLTYAYWARDGVEVDGVKQPLSIDPLARLDAATLERLKLRPEEHGVPFTDETYAVLKQKILDVLDCLPYDIDTFSAQSAADLTKEVQYALLHNSYLPAASIKENYWWQGSGFAADTHATLAQAVWLATVGFDGKTVTDATDNIRLDYVTRRTTLTYTGLAMRRNDQGEAFATTEALVTALGDALKAAQTADSTVTYDSLADLTDYQLQYLILNGLLKDTQTIKDELAAAKTDYWWFTADEPPKSEEGTKTELVVDANEWTAFITAARNYYKSQATFTYTLTDAGIKDVLRLRKQVDGAPAEITAAELQNGTTSDLLYLVLKAIWDSDRKAEFFNTRTKALKKDPTWYEFQYILYNLDKVNADGTFPSADGCEAEKENWPWIWEISGGAVEMEIAEPAADTWATFTAAAKSYYKTQTVSTLTDTEVKDVLRLRRQENGAPVEITAAELQNGTTSDLLYQILNAIWNSDRKAEFFNTRTKALKKDLTWYELQYILYNLDKVNVDGTFPAESECKEWATQENAPWMWREKAAGASLLSLEEDLPVPLAAMPDDVLTTDIVESGPMGASGPTMGSDDPGTSDESISVGRDDPGAPETDETAEIPLGDEMAAVQRASVMALAATPSGGPSFPCGKDSTPRPPKKDFPNGPRPAGGPEDHNAQAGGPGLPQILGLRPQIYAALAAEGGNPLSERSPSIGFSPLGGLRTDRVPLQRLCVGRDDPGAPLDDHVTPTMDRILDPDAPTTNERSIMCLMAGPMILPLSLRRTTR